MASVNSGVWISLLCTQHFFKMICLEAATFLVLSLRQGSKLAPHPPPSKSEIFLIFELRLYDLLSYVSCLGRLVFLFLCNVISFGPPVNDISTTSFLLPLTLRK